MSWLLLLYSIPVILILLAIVKGKPRTATHLNLTIQNED